MNPLTNSWMFFPSLIGLPFVSTRDNTMDRIVLVSGLSAHRSRQTLQPILVNDPLETPTRPIPTDVPVPEPFDVPVPDAIDVPVPDPTDIPPPTPRDIPPFPPKPKQEPKPRSVP